MSRDSITLEQLQKDIPDGDFGYSFYADANSGDLLNDMEKVGFMAKSLGKSVR